MAVFFEFVIGALLVINAAGMFWASVPGKGWFSLLLQVVIGAFGLFTVYEGIVGWCLARALGFRTRL